MAECKRILCIDFDDVIMNTKPHIEKYLKILDARASEEYIKSLSKSKEEGLIDEETFHELEREHYDYKDRILEEVDNEYKGFINYDAFINIENTYPNVVDYVNFLCNCGHYDEVYIVSHHNVDREKEAKDRFIKEFMPKAKYIPVPFHQEKYEKGKRREMTNKAKYLMKKLDINDIINFTLIDDSNRNGQEWVSENGFFWHFMTNGVVKDDKNELASLMPYKIIGQKHLPLLYPGEEERKEMTSKKKKK